MMKNVIFVFCFWLLSSALGAQYLRVHEEGRYLMKEDGTPFFWLGDTAWELFHRLNREEIDYYLRNRAGKGFNVVQAVILSEINGLTVPNREGNLPLIDFDPIQPNEKYFELVDFTVNKAAEYGIYMALLPTWGAHVEDKPHPLFDNKAVFNPANAKIYGEILGSRYKNKWNVIWVLGGDRPPTGHFEIWEALANGLQTGDEGKHLVSYHPMGQQSSSFWFHDKGWLDFNIIQTGHLQFSYNVYDWVNNDYNRKPAKPVIIGEPAYEDIPSWFNPVNPRYNDYEIRKYAWWSVFAGAFGFTYGNNNIWQMYRKGEYEPIIWARTSWIDALEHPGAGQLRYLKELILSKTFFKRIPDQSLLKDENPSFSSDHIRVTRDGSSGKKDATYILVYLPYYRSFSINTSVIESDQLRITWINPRNGEKIPMGVIENSGEYSGSNWSQRIREEQGGPDWVVVIDKISKE